MVLLRYVSIGLIVILAAGAGQADIINVPSDYPTIQKAIVASQSGDQIIVAAGNYVEQLIIDKNITITGAGAGQTIISSPVTLNHIWPPLYYSIIHVENTESGNIEHITISGAGHANGHPRFTGVGFYNSGGSVRHCEITEMTETPISNSANGVGIYTMNTLPYPDPYILTLEDLDIHHYQKGAIVISGDPYVVEMIDIVADATLLPVDSGQNGIEVGLRADATISNCIIKGHHFSYENFTSSGFLSYLGGDIHLVDCQIDVNQTNLYLLDSGGTVNGCTIVGSGTFPAYNGITAVSFSTATSASRSGIPAPLPFSDATDWSGSRDWSELNLADCTMIGTGFPGARGVLIVINFDDVAVNIDRCEILNWENGLELHQSETATLTGACRYTRFAGNVSAGILSDTFVPFDARWNWWNDPSGPGGAGPGNGDFISAKVLYDPWLTGNIVCVPDPLEISSTDWDGSHYSDEVVVYYMGGASGLVYGFSVDIAWDPLVLSANANDFQRPDHGHFSTAPFFLASEIAPGLVRVDAALGGVHPGTPRDNLFKATFTAVATPAYAESDLTFTLHSFRDNNNNPLSGVVTDTGRVAVDLEYPSVTNVVITNTTLGHTNDFIKNGDSALVTAMITDSGSGIDAVTANLSGLGGGSDAQPDSYLGDVATWHIPLVTTSPGDGTVDVDVDGLDLMGNLGSGGDDIIADNTPPSPVTGFMASPGHNLVDMSWDDPTSTDLYFYDVVVRCNTWNGYAWYDPPEPDYPATAEEGNAVWNGIGTNYTETFATDGSERDIIYYQAFARDMAWNSGSADPSARDRATNYWLGDVSGESQYGVDYNGFIDVADITAFGSSYGLLSSDPRFKEECDIGPTDDFSGTGIPVPDEAIEFEDLMILAMNANQIGSGKRPPVTGSPIPLLAWNRLDSRTWSLNLQEPCSNLKGVRLRADLPAGIAAQVTAGACLLAQDAPVFLRNIDRRGLDAGLAVLGKDLTIVGKGELCRVTLSQPADMERVTLEARGIANESFSISTPEASEDVDRPFFSLAPNYPNPFNPSTKISFTLPERRKVRLAVYTLAGRHVVTLLDGERSAGRHEIMWHGVDENDSPMASGSYFYRLDAGSDRQTRKMILMK